MIKQEIKQAIDNVGGPSNCKVAVFSGAGVDPDGLASAWATKLLLEKWGVNYVDCFYRGSFNRPQNKTMREVLSLSFFKNTKDVEDWSKYNFTISVDGPVEVCPTKIDFVIDHHKPGTPPGWSADVREIGSCSAIMYEYVKDELDFGTEEGKLLSTALSIGILTDTNNFKEQSSSQLDFDAAAFFLERKDHKSFISILNFPKPAYYNDLYVLGWNNKVWPGTVLVTGIGDISEQRSGVISDLAEKFCETDGVSTSVVVGLVNSSIVMSVRSSNSAINVDEFCKFFGNGGGKRGAGVAKIALPEPVFSKVSEVDRQTVFDAFFKIIVEKALQFAGDGIIEERVQKD